MPTALARVMTAYTLLAALRILSATCATVDSVEDTDRNGTVAVLVTYESEPRVITVLHAPSYWAEGTTVGRCNSIVRKEVR